MESFFKLRQNGTNVTTELIAGLTTFFAMSYIIVLNPLILSDAGMEWGAVYLATIISAVVGTLIMGLFANVPYAQAPGMGLNAFFTYTVVLNFGFTWQQALAMVFFCGVINILITVTKVRKQIIRSIPLSLQHAISGGIGLFIAYIGLKNGGLIFFDGGNQGLVEFNSKPVMLTLIILVITIILLILKVRGAILIGIIVGTLIAIPMDLTSFSMSRETSLGDSFSQLGNTFGVIFTSEGIPSLFSDSGKILLALTTIFSFSLTDTFDTIGTFIGTGRRSGIFSEADEEAMANNPGLSSRLDRALVADSVATSIGALVGTSNTTTYVESAAGIGAGGRTGLSSVFTALLFILCIPLLPLASAVPGQATAPALILVGVMMVASFAEIRWNDLAEAIPAFFASIFMALFNSITHGIAFGFIAYLIIYAVKRVRGERTEKLHPIMIGSTILFILDFVLRALVYRG